MKRLIISLVLLSVTVCAHAQLFDFVKIIIYPRGKLLSKYRFQIFTFHVAKVEPGDYYSNETPQVEPELPEL